MSFFLLFADLTLNESDSSKQEGERELDKVSNLIGGCSTLIDENGNILKRSLTTVTKTSTSELTISDKPERLILKEESSGSENMQSAKLVSSHDAKESSGTPLKQQITTASFNHGIGSEEQNNLLETENDKVVSESVLKCKYTYMDNHPWVLGTF